MKRALWAILALTMACVLGAQGPAGGARDGGTARFMTCDVFIECGPSRLAAWQVDIKGSVAGGAVELVGVEGGEKGVYENPAFYDAEALTHERVILGAFSTSAPEQLPTGHARVARLHVRVTGEGKPEFSAKVTAAADPAGEKISPTVSIEIGERP
jgi:hypothetical protein